MLAALLRNVHRVSALLEEARGQVWRHQPRAIRAEAGAGAATDALQDVGAGLLGTDEARDLDDSASSLRNTVRGRGAALSGAGEDATRTSGVCEAPRRYRGEGAGGGRRAAKNQGTSRRRPPTNRELLKQVNINIAIKTILHLFTKTSTSATQC